MDIIWENGPERGAAGRYHVLFMRHGYNGAIRQQARISTEERLAEFFLSEVLDQSVGLETREDRTVEWLNELHERRLLSLRPVTITQELFERLTVR